MKNTYKFFTTAISSAFLLSVTVIPTLATMEAAGGPLDDLLTNASTEITESTALKVENLSILPANGKAMLMWDPVTNAEDKLLTRYKISYGKESVEEGFSDEYDESIKVELNKEELETVDVARSEVPELKNGEKYFFVVQAIDTDESLGAKSEEKFTTPSAEEEQLELEKGIAITSNIVKAELSKNVVLDDDIEQRKKTFIINIKNNNEEVFVIKDVVFKENYLSKIDAENNEEEQQEAITEGKELYIILEEEENILDKDTEYQLTASARLKDANGEVIDNGVTDNVFFTGTDETEVSDTKTETEQATSIDPLQALLSQNSAKDTEEETLHAAPNDTTAPEEITNLQAKVIKQVKDFLVNLSWTKSKNTEGDLTQQLFYSSIDNGKSWGEAREFTGDIEDYSFTGKEKTSYTVKITTKDRSGNESKGVVKTIKVPELVSSGAPLFLALGLALMGGGAQIARRKK